jgi:hypothetical protein
MANEIITKEFVSDEVVKMIANDDHIKQLVSRALSSGAVDMEDYEDKPFALVKIVGCAVLKQLQQEWWPHHNAAYVADVNNIYANM